MWQENKDEWEEQDNEEWYSSFSSRAADWCFDVHNSPAYFYSVACGIRALMTGVQCARRLLLNFSKKWRHSHASLAFTDVYLKKSRTVYHVFMSYSLQLYSKFQVPCLSSERNSSLWRKSVWKYVGGCTNVNIKVYIFDQHNIKAERCLPKRPPQKINSEIEIKTELNLHPW